MEARRILLYCTLTFSIVLEVFVRMNNWWQWFGGHMDSVMHLFWGLNVFLMLVVWLRWKPVSALYGVFAMQMGWELIEMVGDIVWPQPGSMLDIFWWDGIKDTIVNMAGGLAGWVLVANLRDGLAGLKESSYARSLRVLPWLMLPGIIIGGAVWAATGSSPQVFAIAWIVLAMGYSLWKN